MYINLAQSVATPMLPAIKNNTQEDVQSGPATVSKQKKNRFALFLGFLKKTLAGPINRIQLITIIKIYRALISSIFFWQF